MDLTKIKKVFASGVGGIGVSALARVLKSKGLEVIGSDMAESEITKKLEKEGIKIYLSQEAKNITKDIDLMFYTPAEGEDHPERKEAKKLGIEQKSYPEMLGELMKNYEVGVAVTGTNGKSTVTSILGLILDRAQFDPTVIVGSQVKQFNNSNARVGDSQYFVVEACEYQANMLNLSPQAIVLTNIEADHLDYYTGLDHIIESFQKFISKLPPVGVLSINADDKNSNKLKFPQTQLVTYGIKNQADLMAQELRVEGQHQIFQLIWKGEDIGRIKLQVPGEFNVHNALAAISLALMLGIDFEPIKQAVEEYSGIWRRFEILGKYKDALVISDYAHHPTAIQGTILATKDFYPDSRILAVFQPHHQNRTKMLFDEFVGAFDKADLTIMAEVYHVAGREEDEDISSEELVEEIEKRGNKVIFAKDLTETRKLIDKNIKPNDVVLIMGAGDIYKVANELVK